MSLDVSLTGELKTVRRECPTCGHESAEEEREEIYSANITHNLAQMADMAGLYKPLWRPDEIGAAKAWQLIELLRDGLAVLRAEPDKFKKLNPKNGWGDYDGLVRWVEDYLRACEENPEANVTVSR